jgi:hypothetical protein
VRVTGIFEMYKKCTHPLCKVVVVVVVVVVVWGPESGCTAASGLLYVGNSISKLQIQVAT